MATSVKCKLQNVVFEKGEHCKDYELAARDSIAVYFSNKISKDGTPINKDDLYSKSSLNTVLRTQFDENTFDFIHNQCLILIPKDKDYYDPTVTWTVHCLINMIKQMCRFAIPKEFQPGLLLLYFKFCFGVKIPSPIYFNDL